MQRSFVENEIESIHRKLETETDSFARGLLNLRLRSLCASLDRLDSVRESNHSVSRRAAKARSRRLHRDAA